MLSIVIIGSNSLSETEGTPENPWCREKSKQTCLTVVVLLLLLR